MKMVEEKCLNDVFENAIRAYGVVAACEWFGHSPDSDFTKDTIKHLNDIAEGNMTYINYSNDHVLH